MIALLRSDAWAFHSGHHLSLTSCHKSNSEAESSGSSIQSVVQWKRFEILCTVFLLCFCTFTLTRVVCALLKSHCVWLAKCKCVCRTGHRRAWPPRNSLPIPVRRSSLLLFRFVHYKSASRRSAEHQSSFIRLIQRFAVSFNSKHYKMFRQIVRAAVSSAVLWIRFWSFSFLRRLFSSLWLLLAPLQRQRLIQPSSLPHTDTPPTPPTRHTPTPTRASTPRHTRWATPQDTVSDKWLHRFRNPF